MSYTPFAEFNKKMIRSIEHKDSSASQLLDWLERAEAEVERKDELLREAGRLLDLARGCTQLTQDIEIRDFLARLAAGERVGGEKAELPL